MAVIAHPHPLYGGTMDNKVVQTLARAFVQLRLDARCASTSAASARSEGQHDEGRGEVDDMLAGGRRPMAPQGPLALAGFSFGGYVARRPSTRSGGARDIRHASCWSARPLRA